MKYKVVYFKKNCSAITLPPVSLMHKAVNKIA